MEADTRTSRSHRKSPKIKQRKLSGHRNNPEGVSIHEKPAKKVVQSPSPQKSRNLSQSKQLGARSAVNKKTVKHKRASKDNGLIDADSSFASQSSKRSRLSDSEIDVDVSLRDLSAHQVPPTPKSGRKVPKKKSPKQAMEKEFNLTDITWEKAVEKARGLPDGALDEDGASMKGQKTGKSVDSAGEGKQSKFEKGKKKPFSLLQNTAKKWKKMVSKPQATKRKMDTTGHNQDSKKAKLEDAGRKERKKQRKMSKINYEMAARSKVIWNQLRQMKLPVEKRKELSDELCSLIKGKAKELIFAHDTSRVIQCLMKYGLQEHKNALFEELKEDVVEMTKSKYAKFFVRKLLKYGTKAQRNYVFRKLYGNVNKLIRHKEASEIIEVAYNDYANAAQRAALVEEFYGPSFALFKTPEARSLEQIMGSQPEKRDAILRNMKDTLSGLVEKTVLQHSIVHRVFLEYFTHATPKMRTEMIESVREGVVEMLHTREGARVAMICLWYGTTKDRKVIIKSFKPYISKICKEEYGHLVLLTLFDVVDDTKLVQKAILTEVLKNVADLALEQYGRKVLLYLLAPRDPIHFHPDVVRVLQEGDENPTSKKEVAVRQQELLEFVSRPLVQYIVQHCQEIVLNNSTLLLMLSIITRVKCDPTDAMRALAQIAAQPFSAQQAHIVEHPAGHITLKKLVHNDVDRMQADEKVLFSSILLDVLPEGALKSWAACNRGCFMLITLLELGHKDITERVRKELAGLTKSLGKLEFKGAQVLLTKLQ